MRGGGAHNVGGAHKKGGGGGHSSQLYILHDELGVINVPSYNEQWPLGSLMR